jgi:hypothetical protein
MDLIILNQPWEDLLFLAHASQAPSANLSGFLFGRKLVQAYLVQKIAVIPRSRLFRPETIAGAERQQRLQVLGLFNFGQEAQLKKRVQQPLFCEKVILSIKTARPAGLRFQSRIVRFNGRFYLARPDRLLIEMEEGNDRKQSGFSH